jgi:hypothetical protein
MHSLAYCVLEMTRRHFASVDREWRLIADRALYISGGLVKSPLDRSISPAPSVDQLPATF